jgi:hypothetical protein
MVAVGTCFRNNAAVIAPALGCKGPAASISAMLDSMDSQQLSSIGSLQNFSPETS